jgi:hypothetical protein
MFIQELLYIHTLEKCRGRSYRSLSPNHRPFLDRFRDCLFPH